MNRFLRCCLLLALSVGTVSMLGCSVVGARERPGQGWPDTPLGRTQALAVLQTLNADLLSHASATLTLERWCAAHQLASPALVVAQRVQGADKPLPAAMRDALHVGSDERVGYRRVRLSCGTHVLSEADNWYLPGRLTAAMNQQLEHSDMPFGKVVQRLHFRRETLSATLLWSPLPPGWEMHDALLPGSTGTLAIPHHVLQHRALLYAADGRPFSALIETYTGQVLSRGAHSASTPAVTFDGEASPYLPDIVSTRYSEVRAAVSPDGSTVLWGSVDRPGGPGGWDIWMVRRQHDSWSAPQAVSFNTAAHEFDPAFSADGTTVWFFSSRPGGFGGDDIWQVGFNASTGRFGTPENAGAAINSAGDEWALAPSPDGRQLLFATNGRGGEGRHDLFISQRRDGAWQAAKPLAGDVNTGDDEFDATFVDAGRGLIYSRSTDVDHAPVALWFARRRADGSFVALRRLDDRVNVTDGFAMGPALDPSQPGVLLFSSKRAGPQRGRSDIYAIRFHVTDDATGRDAD